MNNNVMLGFPNRADQAVLSGGSWVPTLPLSNLQNRIYGNLARTTDCSLASTKILIDLGRVRKIQAIVLRNHNLSQAAKVRVQGAVAADMATLVYESGWGEVWPSVCPYGTLEWEDDNWWGGKYTDEERAGYMTEWDHLLPHPILARYFSIEIDDTGNPAGYLQAGRLFVCPVWQPKVNMIYGASLGLETKTSVQEARSGTEYFDVRLPTRVQKFTLAHMKEDEAFTRAFELMRQAGVHSEILFVHNPADTAHALRRRFLGRLRELNPIEYANVNIHSTAFEVKEML